MALSTNSIMHFTRNFSSLKQILDGVFALNYCKEVFNLVGNQYSLGVPMVSFCDIPLSQVLDHVGKYGSYGIGLSKEWAKSKGVNPVLYMEENSYSANLVEPFLRDVLENDKFGDFRAKYTMEKVGDTVNVTPIKDRQRQLNIGALIGQISFMKNYEGSLNRNNKSKIYKFYDEREWRYVPNYNSSINGEYFPPIQTETEYDTWRGTSRKKMPIENVGLSFGSNDVSYIFVREETEISPLIKNLKKKKNAIFSSQEEFDLLISRILSIERIKSDI